MSNAANHHKINYIEFHSTDIEQTKKFYATVFGWSFVDYGPDYVSFQGAGIDGGFIKSESHDGPGESAPLALSESPETPPEVGLLESFSAAVTLAEFALEDHSRAPDAGLGFLRRSFSCSASLVC